MFSSQGDCTYEAPVRNCAVCKAVRNDVAVGKDVAVLDDIEAQRLAQGQVLAENCRACLGGSELVHRLLAAQYQDCLDVADACVGASELACTDCVAVQHALRRVLGPCDI